jgi:dolichol-phosphate mannosyltransferase
MKKMSFVGLGAVANVPKMTMTSLLTGNALAEPLCPENGLECSLIIPFYNEAESVQNVLHEACAAMHALGCKHEVIAVDDGSSDATRHRAHAMKEQWPNLRVLAFERNRGQAAALLDGLRAAQGRLLITMDGDGQNDPADISRLIEALKTNGADMVAGVRASRKDSWLRKRMSRIANRVRQRLLKDGVRDSGCALKVFRREVCSSFIPIRTLYSFMPALTVAAGYRVAELEVNHRARESGQSKYGLGVMLWRPVLDMLGVWWFASRRFQEIKPTILPCL